MSKPVDLTLPRINATIRVMNPPKGELALYGMRLKLREATYVNEPSKSAVEQVAKRYGLKIEWIA